MLALILSRKRDRMAQFAEELANGAVEYHPFAVSCWGRLHPNAEQMLRNISKRMARREGLSNQRSIEDRLRARITTEVMRRAARMVLRCLPAQTDATVQDDLPVDHHAERRAGDPANLYLPPYTEVLPSGTWGAAKRRPSTRRCVAAPSLAMLSVAVLPTSAYGRWLRGHPVI